MKEKIPVHATFVNIYFVLAVLSLFPFTAVSKP